MSFKREGNDKGLLDNLRRRRVKELLGEDIPEDEAKLLCNGRFACLVCFHNPVFDTVNMLMVHRQGKKHAANEEIFLKKKKELKSLILKRKHEQYMKDGTTDIRQAVASSTGGIMSTTQPYDPRTKRHKVKPYERKPCLDLHTESASSQLLAQPSVSAAVSDSGAFPADVPVKHSHQLKNIFRPAQRSPEPVRPYIRKNKTFTDNSTSFQPTHNAQHSLSVPSRDQNVSQTSACVSSQFSPPISSTSASPLSSSSHSSVTRVPGTCSGVNASSSSSSASHRAGTFTPPEPNLVKQSVHSSGTSQQSSGSFSNLCGTAGGREDGTERASSVPQSVQARANPGHVGVGGSVENAAEKKQRAQKYYHLSGSGWKKDWDGKWIRDEDAEFDSDEEPPDLP